LIEYLETNKLLESEQHGFRPGKSTVTAGVDFIQTIIDAIDRGDKVVGVLMDLCKAFESVSLEELLLMLSKLGIKNKELRWFHSYLTNRKQYVEIAHSQNNYILNFPSSLQTTRSGVPQGSILGPLLFLCYLKGLPNLTGGMAQMGLYADDGNIIFTGKPNEDMKIICLKFFLWYISF